MATGEKPTTSDNPEAEAPELYSPYREGIATVTAEMVASQLISNRIKEAETSPLIDTVPTEGQE